MGATLWVDMHYPFRPNFVHMTGKITILVGTMSGTAEMVADAMLEAIEDAGVTGRILRMEKARVEALSAGGVWLVCTSTYGTGEVPDNAKALYAALGEQRPDLSKVRYGVVALGDSIYPNTFCFGGKRFDELLAALGARRIGERLENDSRSPTYPDDTAREWLEGWLETLRQSSDEADGATTEGAEISR